MDEELKQEIEKCRKKYHEAIDQVIDSNNSYLVLIASKDSMLRLSYKLDEYSCIGILETAKKFYIDSMGKKSE